jgi:hypothetical protein
MLLGLSQHYKNIPGMAGPFRITKRQEQRGRSKNGASIHDVPLSLGAGSVGKTAAERRISFIDVKRLERMAAAQPRQAVNQWGIKSRSMFKLWRDQPGWRGSQRETGELVDNRFDAVAGYHS